ncbi:MAG: DUF2723 domain-containing protein [Chloroflexi bacterium]|nr:DUF2723 domain-containing protein [Chloroflexota bacterium]
MTALALFAVALATRLPLLTDQFWAHDSVLYTRAVQVGFDPADHRPQPPGYLWYVALVRVVDTLTADPVRAMTLISAVAAAASVALLYLLARRMYDERTGAIAALFLMTSVTFWGESLVALPYTLLALCTVTVALLLWRVLERAEPPHGGGVRGRRLALASLAWGVAVGFRSDLAYFLAPAWLLAAVTVPLRWTLASAAAAGGAVLVWLGSTLALTPGGAERYFAGLRDHLDFIDRQYSVSGRGMDALANNLRELARYTGRALFALAGVLAVVLVSRDVQRIERREPRRALFLFLWALAPLPVNVLVHAGEYGYVFSMLPGLCVIAARGTIGAARGARLPQALPWLAGAVVAVNAGIFLFSDQPLTRRDIAKRDDGIREKVAAIAPLAPHDRVIVVSAYDQVIVEHHLPGRRRVAYLPDATPSTEIPLTCAAPTCLVFAWDEYFRTGSGWTTAVLPSGSLLRSIEVPSGATLLVRDGLTLEVARP